MDELLEYTYVLIDSCELFPYASIKKNQFSTTHKIHFEYCEPHPQPAQTETAPL